MTGSGMSMLTVQAQRTSRVRSGHFDGLEDPLPDILAVCTVCNKAQMTEVETQQTTKHRASNYNQMTLSPRNLDPQMSLLVLPLPF